MKINPKICANKECGKEFKPRRLSTERVCSFPCSLKYAEQKRFEKEEREGIISFEGKPKNKFVAFPKVYLKENKKNLQAEINKLARKIDLSFGHLCIDCGKKYGKQIDGSHFHNVQGNENLRYNLHNIHAAKSDCNQFGSGRKKEYKEGLIERYGKDYADFVDYELPKKYPYLGITANEIVEKLKLIRKLIRTFDSFVFKDAEQARNQLNKIIGIYEANR